MKHVILLTIFSSLNLINERFGDFVIQYSHVYDTRTFNVVENYSLLASNEITIAIYSIFKKQYQCIISFILAFF